MSFFYSSFFFRSCSCQEIILSALIGQFHVSNLRRVAFIFHWPIVHRLHNALSITRSPISKQSTPQNTSPASKCNLPLFHPKIVKIPSPFFKKSSKCSTLKPLSDFSHRIRNMLLLVTCINCCTKVSISQTIQSFYISNNL